MTALVEEQCGPDHSREGISRHAPSKGCVDQGCPIKDAGGLEIPTVDQLEVRSHLALELSTALNLELMGRPSRSLIAPSFEEMHRSPEIRREATQPRPPEWWCLSSWMSSSALMLPLRSMVAAISCRNARLLPRSLADWQNPSSW
uniref:Uncharacterized protein n=1 Tax=Heterorhabditis bacteriophora TaxID=37862 RepID=A0A1I7WDB2_HETBA